MEFLLFSFACSFHKQHYIFDCVLCINRMPVCISAIWFVYIKDNIQAIIVEKKFPCWGFTANNWKIFAPVFFSVFQWESVSLNYWIFALNSLIYLICIQFCSICHKAPSIRYEIYSSVKDANVKICPFYIIPQNDRHLRRRWFCSPRGELYQP